MKKLLLLAATVISASVIAPRAQAGLSFAISIGPHYAPPPVHVAPRVYAPAPVVVSAPVCAPAPVVVAAPVYYAPTVYYAPPAPRVAYYGHGYHGRWAHHGYGYRRY